MTNVVPTGIDILDRKLDGGLPAGSIVALSADPASQSELFLYEFATARQSLYLTTKRSESAIKWALLNRWKECESVAIRELRADKPLIHAANLVESLPHGVNVIIDPMDVCEQGAESRLQNFFNEFRSQIATTDSLAFLHCLDGRNVPDNRDTTEYMADVVFELTMSTQDTIEYRLTVPKYRGGEPPTDAIKLDLAETVNIDISRDIA